MCNPALQHNVWHQGGGFLANICMAVKHEVTWSPGPWLTFKLHSHNSSNIVMRRVDIRPHTTNCILHKSTHILLTMPWALCSFPHLMDQITKAETKGIWPDSGTSQPMMVIWVTSFFPVKYSWPHMGLGQQLKTRSGGDSIGWAFNSCSRLTPWWGVEGGSKHLEDAEGGAAEELKVEGNITCLYLRILATNVTTSAQWHQSFWLEQSQLCGAFCPMVTWNVSLNICLPVLFSRLDECSMAAITNDCEFHGSYNTNLSSCGAGGEIFQNVSGRLRVCSSLRVGRKRMWPSLVAVREAAALSSLPQRRSRSSVRSCPYHLAPSTSTSPVLVCKSMWYTNFAARQTWDSVSSSVISCGLGQAA